MKKISCDRCNFSFSILLPAVLLLGNSGCSHLNQQFPNLGLPEYEMTTTGLGAVTGTALGTGVGAVIGSASGNAGEGAFLGAMSGATAGAVVGNSIQRGNEALALQEKRVVQQSREIQKLDNELERLRAEGGDVVSRQSSLGQNGQMPVGMGRASQNLTNQNQQLRESNIIENGSYRDGTARGSLGAVQPGLPAASGKVAYGEEFSQSARAAKQYGRGSRYAGNSQSERVNRNELANDVSLQSGSILPQETRKNSNNLDSAPVYQAQVNNDELAGFLSKIPVRKKRAEAVPVKATAFERKDSTRLPSESRKISARLRSTAEVSEIKIPKVRTPKPLEQRPKKEVRQIGAKSSELSVVDPEALAEMAKPLPAVKSSKPIRVAKIETPSKAKIAKAASVPSSKAKIDIEPPTIRKIGKQGKVAEELVKKTAEPVKEVARVAPAPVEVSSSRVEHNSASCLEAENEAERARESTSDADKLYYYRRALRLCPESSNYHLETGRAYAAIGRLEDAAFEYRQAIDLDPSNSSALQQLESINNQ